MRRLPLLLLVLGACLDPGGSIYERFDTVPPTVLFDLMKPKILALDGGPLPIVQPGQTIELPFSEEMDPNSLRPGIVIRMGLERTEVPLLIQAPPPNTSPYVVRLSAADKTFLSATYSLQLRSLLIDRAGNQLAEGPETTGFFRVP